MKTLYFYFILLISYLPTVSFVQTTLSGSVRTSDNKSLPFATVVLLNACDSSLVKRVITQQTGIYTFDNIRPGHYRLAASVVGYVCTKPVGDRAGRPADAPA